MSDFPTHTTVSGGNFPHEDISHKPKRFQGDSFVGTPLHINPKQEKQDNTGELTIPEYVTIERIMQYCEAAVKKYGLSTKEGKFYNCIYDYLKELRELRSKRVDVVERVKQERLVASLKDKEVAQNEVEEATEQED